MVRDRASSDVRVLYATIILAFGMFSVSLAASQQQSADALAASDQPENLQD